MPAWRFNALSTILTFILPATFCARGNFDIVHAQGLCGLRHNVITAHFCQAGWFAALERENVRLDWKQKVAQCLVSPLEARAFSRADCEVIAVSRRVAADLHDYYGCKSNITVTYHGVDLDRFHPRNHLEFRDVLRAEIGADRNAFLALYVGDVKKGAIPAIRSVAKTDDVQLLIVTSSKTEDCRQLAQKLGISNRVMFHPLTKQIERIYAGVDALVFPTLYDAYGMVISEAMAAGLPVITNSAAGAAEIITTGINGILTASAWDDDAISRELRRLRDDEQLCRELGSAARKTIERYSWDQVASDTLQVYRRILSRTKYL